MLVDADTPGRSDFPGDVDVCVIGSGPAGITIARRLAAAGSTVALMEAGGMDMSAESQDFYQGDLAGLDYFPLDAARLRYFGGSSNHWGGMCRTLDSYDFDRKPYEPLSGWPISRFDLDPYRSTADEILDVIPESEAPDLPLQQISNTFRRFQFRYSSPTTRFNAKYGAVIQASNRIYLCVNANLVDLRLDEALGTVTAAIFRSYQADDPGFEVRARFYALCTGGIENPRLLLNFCSQLPEGIGNRSGLVGRYFAEHPTFVLADTLLAQPVHGDWEANCYAPTEAFMAEQQILDFSLRLEPSPPEPLVLKGAVIRGLACESDFTEHLASQVLGRSPHCELGGIAAYRAGTPQTALIRTSLEQALNYDSCVGLTDRRDALGLRTTVLDWQLSELDYKTMRTAIMAFGKHMAEQNIGRVKVRDWVLADPLAVPDTLHDEVAGYHHMGTTRMADDPRRGVVDAHCRVHELDNLYIGGSSVFPTGGYANPTYTITQLALRLGDHLATRLSS